MLPAVLPAQPTLYNEIEVVVPQPKHYWPLGMVPMCALKDFNLSANAKAVFALCYATDNATDEKVEIDHWALCAAAGFSRADFTSAIHELQKHGYQ